MISNDDEYSYLEERFSLDSNKISMLCDSNKILMIESEKKPQFIWWSESDDKKLREIYDHLRGNILSDSYNIWTEVAKYFPGRTRDQCRKRWKYKLDPSKKRDNWSKADDETLSKLQKLMGNKWTSIGKIMDNRSDIEIKNRYHILQRQSKNKNNKHRQAVLTSLPNRHEISISKYDIMLNQKYGTKNFGSDLPLLFHHYEQRQYISDHKSYVKRMDKFRPPSLTTFNSLS